MFRSAEVTEIQLRDMANDPAVHGIGVAKKKPPFRKTPSANEDRPSSSKIMPLKKLKKIEGDNPKMDLCNQKLVSYSEDNLKVLGIIKLPVKSKSDVEQELTFHVVETNQPGLLGLRSSQNLGLIKVVMTAKTDREESTTDNSSQTTKTSQELKKEVFQKYAQVFTGLGCLEKPYHIEIDPTVSQL